MPELPEVETIRRDLAPRVVGRTITAAEVMWERTIGVPTAAELVQRLPGRRIVDTGRRGKLLLLCLEGGDTLAIHLRMTGRLLLRAAGAPPDPYLRVRLLLDDGTELRFADQRKFGRLYLISAAELRALESRLGPEPLDAETGRERVLEVLRRRRGALKPLLLNQAAVAGLGNIYVNEALFRAGLHPLRRAESLTEQEGARLYDAIRDVLEAGIQNGGTTLASFVSGTGSYGRNQDYLLVHQRAGQPCPRCGTRIERIVVGQRGTFICPRCQPAP